MKTETSPAVQASLRYDQMTVALHWLTAGLVILQFGLAELWGFFPRPAHRLMVLGHMSFGLVLAAVFATRIIWRLPSHRTHFNDGPDLMALLARLMHRTLYVLLAAEIVLGVATRWTDNHPLSFFGLLIASPFGTFSRATGHFVDQIHDWNAWVIIVLAGAHAAVALLHHFVLRDGVLGRMAFRSGKAAE
ncbi:MAG: cytochrome b [Rhodospirillales bacterium]|nr:cytochrome b [Rhodospirillales bacterium]